MTPTIPEAALQNALDAFEKTATTRDGIVAAITAAIPFITGVTVKKLEWNEYGERSFKAETALGRYVITAAAVQCYRLDDPEENTEFHNTFDAAEAAAQADYEARILSAIEVGIPATGSSARDELLKQIREGTAHGFINDGSHQEGNPDLDCPYCGGSGHKGDVHPSPRAQALEEAAKIAFDVSENGEYHGEASVDSTSSIYQQGAFEVYEAIRSLSQPVSPDMGVERPLEGGWLPIEKEPDSKQGPFLVTNNPNALNAFGRPSHVWCVSGIYKEKDGSFCAFEGNQKIHGLVMFMPVEAPFRPQAPGVAV